MITGLLLILILLLQSPNSKRMPVLSLLKYAFNPTQKCDLYTLHSAGTRPSWMAGILTLLICFGISCRHLEFDTSHDVDMTPARHIGVLYVHTYIHPALRKAVRSTPYLIYILRTAGGDPESTSSTWEEFSHVALDLHFFP